MWDINVYLMCCKSTVTLSPVPCLGLFFSWSRTGNIQQMNGSKGTREQDTGRQRKKQTDQEIKQ